MPEDEARLRREIEAARRVLTPHAQRIERLRIANPGREVGGYVLNDTLHLFPESSWQRSCVEHGLTFEEVRLLGEQDALNIHTHPRHGIPYPSPQDQHCALFSLREAVFTHDGTYLVLPEKILSVPAIREHTKRIEAEALRLQQEYLRQGYEEDVVWITLRLIREQLPSRIVTLSLTAKE